MSDDDDVRESKDVQDVAMMKWWIISHGSKKTFPVLKREKLKKKNIEHFIARMKKKEKKESSYKRHHAALAGLTLESSCWVFSSSSSSLVPTDAAWLPSSSTELFPWRESLPEEVVGQRRRSGGEELRDFCRRNSSMASLWKETYQNIINTRCIRKSVFSVSPRKNVYSVIIYST